MKYDGYVISVGGSDYLCKGSYFANKEKYKVVGNLDEARVFKTKQTAENELKRLEEEHVYKNLFECEVVKISDVYRMDSLKNVWNNIDKAYEYMERAIEELVKMDVMSNDLQNAIEKFDMSEISYIKQLVEDMMESE